jgi:outer membrane immunogenic protein
MKRALLISALLASIAPAAAYAADAIDAVPAAPEAVEQPVPAGWDGPYVGVMGGGEWLKSHLDFGGTSLSHTEGGGLIGTFAGYNYQFENNFVLGLEGDFSYNWNKATKASTDFGTDWQGAIRARAGYALDDNALLYGAAGWTVTRGYLDPPGAVDKGHKTLNGYTLGLGVDYKFTDNIFARAEYRFNDFGGEKIHGVDFNPQQHQVIFGVGYKF